jgi:V8-like Glu-specific endopeptidase
MLLAALAGAAPAAGASGAAPVGGDAASDANPAVEPAGATNDTASGTNDTNTANRTADEPDASAGKDSLSLARATADNPALATNASGYTVPTPEYGPTPVAGAAGRDGAVVHDFSDGTTREVAGAGTGNATDGNASGPASAPAVGSVARQVDATATPVSVKYADDRVRVENTTAYPYRSATRLFARYGDSGSICSGSIVGPYHVLTAAHCVYGGENGHADEVRVAPAATNGSTPFGTVGVGETYLYTEWVNEQTPRSDIALLTLNASMGNVTGWMGMAYADPDDGLYGERLYTAGFPGDKCQSNYVGSCPMYRTNASGSYAEAFIHYHRIDLKGGQSGSAAWVREEGVPYTVSVNAYSTLGDDTDNFGTRITERRLADFRSWMRTAETPEDAPNLVDDGERWAVLWNTNLTAGETLRVRSDVRNVGTANVTNGSVAYYLSADARLGPEDTELGREWVRGLEPFAYADVGWSGTLPAGVADGEYRVIRAVSGGGSAAVGEKSRKAAVRDPTATNGTHLFNETVAVDRNGPAVRIGAPAEGAVETLPLTVRANATDAGSRVVSASVRVGGSWEPMERGADGWTATLTGYDDGRYPVVVRASDAAGNRNTARVNVTIDTGGPELGAVSPNASAPAYARPGGTVNATLAYDEVNPAELAVRAERNGTVLTERAVADPPGGSAETVSVHLGVPTDAPSGAYDLVWRLTGATTGESETRRAAGALVVDRAAPSVAASANRTLVAPGARISVTARASDDVRVSGVTANGTALTRNGTWTGTVRAPTENGTATLPVRARDPVERVGETSLNVSVDAFAPDLTLNAPERSAGNVSVSGSVTDAHAVNATLETPSGAASVPLGPAGGFAAELTLPEGEHTLRLVAADAVGNRAATNETVTVDRHGPALSGLSERYVATADPLVGARLDDALGSVDAAASEIALDGADVTADALRNATLVRYRAGNLSEGRHRVTVRAADGLGNAREGSWNVTVDTVAPALSGALGAANVSPGADLAVRADASDRTALSVTANGTALARGAEGWNGSLRASPAIGTHTVSLVAADAAGNTNATALRYAVGNLSRATLTNGSANVTPDGPFIESVGVEALPNAANGSAGDDSGNETVAVRTGTATTPPGEYGAPADHTVAYPQVSVAANGSVGASARLAVPRERLRESYLTASSLDAWVRANGSWEPATVRNPADGPRLTVGDLPEGESVLALSASPESDPPTIDSLAPAPDVSPSGNATVAANYTDGYSGIEAANVSLALDGEDVTADARVTGERVAYTVGPGTYNATVTVADAAGNERSRSWSFSVAESGGGPALGGLGGAPSARDEPARATEPGTSARTTAPTTTAEATTVRNTTATTTAAPASTTTDGTTARNTSEGSAATTESPGTPGFGVLVALFALLFGLARRR